MILYYIFQVRASGHAPYYSLEKAGQGLGIKLISRDIWNLGHGVEPFAPTKALAVRLRQHAMDTPLGGPGPGPDFRTIQPWRWATAARARWARDGGSDSSSRPLICSLLAGEAEAISSMG